MSTMFPLIAKLTISLFCLWSANGCASQDYARTAVKTDKTSNCVTGKVVNLEDVVKQNQAVLIGEVHGTEQMPSFLIHVVEIAASSGLTTSVALEFDKGFQGDFDDFFSSEKSGATSELSFLATTDGRSSAAMKDMLFKLRDLASGFPNIKVFAVDEWPDETKINDVGTEYPVTADLSQVDLSRPFVRRDIEMGLNAVYSCENIDCDLLIYFAGNLHTKTDISQSATLDISTGEITKFKTAPAGYIIASEYITRSIILKHRGGISRSTGVSGTAKRSFKANTPPYVLEDFKLYCATEADKYDYVLSVGNISASE